MNIIFMTVLLGLGLLLALSLIMAGLIEPLDRE